MTESKIVECRRCGEDLLLPCVPLPVVAQLQKLDKTEHLNKLIELTGIKEKEARTWIKHMYHGACKENEAFCPSCSGKLKTWKAKMCLHCGENWRTTND